MEIVSIQSEDIKFDPNEAFSNQFLPKGIY